MKLYKYLILLLFCSISQANDLQIRYGIGIFVPDTKNPTEIILVSLAHQRPFLKDLLVNKIELGAFSDSRSDLGRRSSGYIADSIGLRIQPFQGFYVESLWGLSALSHTDSWLGSHFQFMQDLGIGFVDSNSSTIGLSYKHISSAGLFLPNKGRDFIVIQIGIPLK